MYLSREEYEILLKKSTAPLTDILPLCVQTGLRLSELLSLEKQDIDFPGGYIVIGRRKLTKSKKSRIIPIGDDIATMLQTYPDTGRLFPYTENYISHKFKKLVLTSGLNPKLRFHSLRHTFASWLVQSGVSIYMVQRLLGHSSVTVTSIYSHLELTGLRGCIEKIKGV